MHKYIIAIDQGTSATKVILFDETGALVHRVNGVHKQYYPQTGWVEQDASEIFSLTCSAIKSLINTTHIEQNSLLALAITNQTGAFVIWDKQTGDPVYHIVGWQCNRGEKISRRIAKEQARLMRKKCGSDPSGFSIAVKLQWILENVKGLEERALRGELLFGTIDCYLIWKLTAGKVHATDYCNASNTHLFNLNELCWDSELLSLFHVPRCMLPEVKNADADYGVVDVEGLPSLPITGVMGDSAAALFAQCGFEQGSAKITYGTGASLLMNLGNQAAPPPEHVATTIGWGMGADEVTYAWEGTAMYVGDMIEWLVKDIQLLPNAASSESIALEVEHTGGVYIVPAVNGGLNVMGMCRGTKRAHIVRAALESIAYQIKDMTEAMVRDSGCSIPYFLVDGGVARNRMLMQFQTDILGIPIIRSELEENSALGAAYMAGLSVGLFKNKNMLRELKYGQQRFEPVIVEQQRARLYEGWKHAVRQSCIHTEYDR